MGEWQWRDGLAKLGSSGEAQWDGPSIEADRPASQMATGGLPCMNLGYQILAALLLRQTILWRCDGGWVLKPSPPSLPFPLPIQRRVNHSAASAQAGMTLRNGSVAPNSYEKVALPVLPDAITQHQGQPRPQSLSSGRCPRSDFRSTASATEMESERREPTVETPSGVGSNAAVAVCSANNRLTGNRAVRDIFVPASLYFYLRHSKGQHSMHVLD